MTEVVAALIWDQDKFKVGGQAVLGRQTDFPTPST